MGSITRIRKKGLIAGGVAVLFGSAGALTVAPTPAVAAPAVAAVAASTPPATGTAKQNKEMVTWFYDQLFNQGNVAVIDQVVRPGYIQHNPSFATGAAALKKGVTDFKKQFPQSRVKIYRVLGQGNLVAIHSNLTLNPGDRGSAVVDIFRLQGGKIAEQWDVIQDVPATTVSGNDMFSTLSKPVMADPDPRSSRATTKRVALGLFRGLFVDKDVTTLDRFPTSEYIQHNPGFPSGYEPLRAALPGLLALPGFDASIKRVIIDGDFALIHTHYKFGVGDRGTAGVDIYRVRNGQPVEHWDVLQPVPETSLNDNTMF